MTNINCEATACVNNSAESCNSCNGICLAKNLYLVVDDEGNYVCSHFEWDKLKTRMSNTQLKEFGGN